MKFRIPFRKRPPVVPVVRLTGVIGQVGAFRKGLTLESVEPLLDRAFDIDDAKEIALVVNSPGGSPVQSELIAGRIRALALEKEKRVTAFVEDVAASGGYWLATAADEILLQGSSVVGSIGVISAGFGFTEAIAKLGIERRLYTAGESKALLDPFSPEKPEDVARLKDIQEQIHANFIGQVNDRRGAKLIHPNGDTLFDGRVLIGAAAVKAGLADGLGDVRATMRARYGEKVKLPKIAEKRGALAFLRGGGVEAAAGSFAGSLLGQIEERAHWARWGL
ncbi:MAG: S49 family peptidase [Alphaproteobacteria bacterium]|nr:S49 family peptidase [Alphaproteobacteria bacterium]